MRRILLIVFLLAGCAFAKQHTITFGKPMAVKLFVGPSEDKTQAMTVRALYVDGNLREFTTGEPHDVTDRMFVVRRVFRVNDALPTDDKKVPAWKWQRGGWLMVERASGHVTRLNLPDFDPYYSNATWFRDYAAYCGLSQSDAASKLYAVVVQLGQKRPLIHKQLGAARGEEMPDSECAPPKWERAPVRVTFAPVGKPAASFEVHGRWAEPAETPATAGSSEDDDKE
ncbi:MAG: hypothetical protein M3P27_07390 [Acidobacteriota bacterium]|nr:hypothetical protein [Acidobacteriota bacterium]